MKRDNRFRIWLVIILVGISLFSLLPTIRMVMMGQEQRDQLEQEDPQAWRSLQSRAIKLGLDLRGGMHLVMEIDLDAIPPEGRSDAQDRFLSIIRNRIDQYGVSEPVIQKQGNNRVIVELAGVDDTEAARDLVGRTAVLSYNLLKPGELLVDLINRMNRVLYEGLVSGEIDRERIGLHLVMRDSPDLIGIVGLDSTTAGVDSTSIPEQPLSLYLLANPSVPEVLWADEDRMAWVDSIFALPQISSLISADAEFHWGMWTDERFSIPDGPNYRELFLIEASPVVTGDNLEDATVTIGGPQDPDSAGRPIVNFRLTTEGGRIIRRITRVNIGNRMAIMLDGRVAIAPVIESALGASSRITGLGEMEEARNVAITLRSGALPAPASIVEERTVGPSLGADSIRSGALSALVGLLVVIMFMFVYYKGSGLIANTALILNVLFIMAVLAGFHFTLTVPGIAGIILTMGMAVDANVLIYDRIKEEMRAGKTVRAAIDAGYENATSAILDANITTLITALVLYQFGTGPLRGFALTLSVGIVSSVFTALIVTRLMFDARLDRAADKELSI